MVAEEVVITLSGGAPWGFRLQGGAEHKKPLQVAKVRKRSKACRAGLREADELVSINENSCGELSHAQAMNLIDSTPGTLHIRVKRAPAGFQSVVLLTRAPSPRIDKEYRATLRAMTPPASKPPPGAQQGAPVSVTGRSRLTSPPGSEAYYGETDSDADITHEKQRRQKRRSPSSSPGKTPGRASPEETSEMSGYDSAPDARAHSSVGPPETAPGVARREVVYQPPGEWSSQTETSTENSSVSTDDQNPRDGATEEDSGFQEPQSLPPLVSPERAKEALLLASRKQLVPMVGPVDNPVDEELTVTYMDKAKQAKLHRGDSVQDKQVKEARTKCRTIASLLTDAPNPHSKGVLMFKKRRQRSKKYTLTSFGSVDEDMQQDSHEEDGVFPGSESEFDEDGFAAAADSTWDSDYLDMLEKKAGQAADGTVETESPGLTATSGKGAQLFEQQRKRAAEHAKKVAAKQQQQPPPPPQPTEMPAAQPETHPSTVEQLPPPPPPNIPTLAPPPGFAAMNGDSAAVTEDAVAVPPPAVAPKPVSPPALSVIQAELPPLQLPDLPPSSVLNRTARPFAPGFISHRAATAPVVFRPNVAKKTRPATTPTVALPPFSSPPSEAKSAVPPASPHLSARPTPLSAPPAVSAPPSSVEAEPFSPPPMATGPTPLSIPSPALNTHPVPTVPFGPQISAVPAPALAPVVSVTPTAVPRPTREPRSPGISSRTGILEEARKRSSNKPMFHVTESKKNSPNPELLSMVQNLDDRSKAGPEVGFESGPEEDHFNLGAEACNFMQGPKGRIPPPVAPKPRVIPEVPHIPQMEGKGAQLFARRQSRMDLYVVDNAPQQPAQAASTAHTRDLSPTPSLPAYWKYSPNIRAPPPIGYNPLLSPSCPPGAQRGTRASEAAKAGKKGGPHKEGIKALDAMRRQPYQLNSAMFSFSPAQPSYQSTMQRHAGHMMGSSLSSPRQIPVKAARVYEIKRFSTPTPMSAPTTLTPTVITPRSATTLGEPLCHSDATSPPPAPSPPSSPPHAPKGALPELPKISSAPIPNSVPVLTPGRVPGLPYGGLQAAKQFKSAPELSPLPVRAAGLQVPKPRFVASRMGIQANVWRPGSMHH